ncbi:hypothetical protein AYO38_11285 [bacterium SCGC AG-212-C10]|nr:hypothetical protein AYO38_11285 [bacterium SCGC AG-212-C10]
MVLAAAVPIVGALSMTMPAAAGAQLTRGWNNVSYEGTSLPPSEALATLEGKYDSVYRWDAAAQQFDLFSPNVPGFVNSMDMLQKGDSVWINLKAESAELGAQPTGIVAVPASAFTPASDLAIYEKTFNEIGPVGTDEASKRYFAEVHLPQGATVASMTAAFAASGAGVVQLRLDYTPIGNGATSNQIFKLVEVNSSSGASPKTEQAFAHTVDNSANVYFLVVDLTGGPATKLRGVSIAYTEGHG